MPQRLSDLKKECLALGLDVKPGLKPAKEPYLQALRDHYIKRDYPNGLPYEELTPMLCYDFWKLPPKEQIMLWRNDGWICQEKLNGIRLILHFVRGVGIFAHSRTTSVHTYRRSDLTNHLLFGDFVPSFNATVDTEIVASSLQQTNALLHMKAEDSRRIQQDAPLTVNVFDIVRWQEFDLRLRPLPDRLSFMPDFQAAITSAQLAKDFVFPPIFFQNKEAVYKKIVAEGKEGVVLKNLNSHYEDSSSRSRNRWIKVKRQVAFDAFISGFERGKPGSEYENKISCLIFSVNTQDSCLSIAKISNLPWLFRKEISVFDKTTNTVELAADLFGKVANIVGLELSRKARRLVHPRISFWRRDLVPEQCLYSAADLESLRLGNAGVLPMRIIRGGGDAK
jgi:ATP-dependent DNA ligase